MTRKEGDAYPSAKAPNRPKPEDIKAAAIPTPIASWVMAAFILLLFRLQNPNAADPTNPYYGAFEDQVADFFANLPMSQKFYPKVKEFAKMVHDGTLANELLAVHVPLADLLTKMGVQGFWGGCAPVPWDLLTAIAELDDPSA